MPKTPSNTNILQPTKFALSFARLPNVQFWCQKVKLPGLGLNALDVETPFVVRRVPGNKVDYEPLQIEMLVDENLSAWEEIHDWQVGLGFPVTFEEYRILLTENAQFGGRVSEATLTIYDGQNRPIKKYIFVDAFPIKLSGVPMDSTDSADTILKSDVTFAYTLMLKGTV